MTAPLLTLDQVERLALLVEELGEVRREQIEEVRRFVERVPDRTLVEVISFVRQLALRAQETP